MKKLVVANYKMNGNINFYKRINKVVNKLKVKDTNIILCPPFVYMPFFKLKNKNVFLGAQDVSMNDDDKSTGQICGKMLKEFNVKYCIVGHKERRELGETSEIVATKVKMAQIEDIVPIICVGEQTKTTNLNVLVGQVESALGKAENKELIFVYEPIWAIGTGKQPSKTKINKALKIIKDTAKKCGFNVLVLYGGSVNKTNIKEVSKCEADGVLLGGVSLKIDEFVEICKGV